MPLVTDFTTPHPPLPFCGSRLRLLLRLRSMGLPVTASISIYLLLSSSLVARVRAKRASGSRTGRGTSAATTTREQIHVKNARCMSRVRRKMEVGSGFSLLNLCLNAWSECGLTHVMPLSSAPN